MLFYKTIGIIAMNLHNYILSWKNWVNLSEKLTQSHLSRPILLDFWTFCCADCINLLPELEDIESTFGNKILVIGVHSGKFTAEKENNNILHAINKYNIKHPVVNDHDFKIWDYFKAQCWPTLILFDENGNLVKHYGTSRDRIILENERKNLKADILATINKNPIETPLNINFTPKLQESFLSYPSKIKFFKDDMFFIADSGNNRILLVNTKGELLLCIDNLNLNFPQGIVVKDDILYICDTKNDLVKSFNLKTFESKIICGTGKKGKFLPTTLTKGTEIDLSLPTDIEIFEDKLIIANSGTHQLLAINENNDGILYAGNGNESLVDGELKTSELAQTSGLLASDEVLYVLDSETSSLRFVKNNQIQTLIGKSLFDFGFVDGNKNTAKMQHPLGFDIDKETGKIYIADAYNNKIRVFDPKNDELSTLGIKNLFEPSDLIIYKGYIIIADCNNNKIVAKHLKGGAKTNIIINKKPKIINICGSAFFKLNHQGYKINPEITSELFLMRGREKINSYALESENQVIKLKNLDDGNYTLQGLVYCCSQENGSCFVFKVNQKLAASPDGLKGFSICLN